MDQQAGFGLGRARLYWTDTDIISGQEGERLMAIKRAVLESGVGTRVEASVTFNGEKHYFDLTVEPQRDHAGSIQGGTCASTDITPMKRARVFCRLVPNLPSISPIEKSARSSRISVRTTDEP